METRNMKTILRRVVGYLSFAVLLLSFNSTSKSVVLDDETDQINTPILSEQSTKEQTPQYIPGEVIVKLKEKDEPQKLFSQSYSTRSASHEEKLSRLKTQYRLRNERPVFKGLHEQLKAKNLSQNALERENDVKLLKNQSKTFHPKNQIDLLPIYVLNTDEDVLAVCNQLKQDPDIEYAQPNYIYHVQMVPNDPYYHSSGSWGQSYDDLWGIKKIQCEQAWDASQGEEVVVAVIDTGVDYNHPDLWDNIWVNPAVISDITGDGKINLDDCDLNHNKIIEENEIVDHMFGWDFAYGDNNPMDGKGHGTHCSGTIAGIGNNGIGVIGVAPKAKIMAIKGLDDTGGGWTTDLADSIRYAADNGARVLSNSWGFGGRHPSDPTLEGAVDYAYDGKGCVVVFAAGNSCDDVAYYSPSNYSKTIAVAAITQYDEKCFFSNYGSLIDVSAPGGGDVNELGSGWNDIYNILSTLPDNSGIAGEAPELKVSNGYWRLGGTSMACPHVAGLAALILSQHPGLSNETVRQIIRVSSDDIGQPEIGYGRINASNAVSPTILEQGGTLQFSSPTYTVNENSGNATITVKRTTKIGGTITVDYETSDGTAIAGQDYTATSGTLTFGEEDIIETFIIPIINDYEYEKDETVNLTLSNPAGEGAALGTPVNAVLTIIDDEAQFTDSGVSLPGVFRGPLAWGDYNNDGYLDLAICGDSIPGTSSAITKIYRNNGDGTFTDINAGLIGLRALAWGDYNNDGYLDLAACGWKSDLRENITKIYRNNGNGTFTDIGSAGLIGAEGPLAWGDYDNDGKLDLVLCDRDKTSIYRNNGNGTFTDIEAGLPGLWFDAYLALGDYDNDGYLDLAVCGVKDYQRDSPLVLTSRIYRNNGDGTFTNVNAGLQGVTYGSLAWGDYDNDGNLDLALSGNTLYSSITKIYRNNGNGTFTDINAKLPGVSLSSISWGDYDNDGYLDLAISGSKLKTLPPYPDMEHEPIITKIYRNNRDGTFSDIEAGLGELVRGSIRWGDYDNDGDLDLAVSGVDTIEPFNGNTFTKLYKNPEADSDKFNHPNIIPSAPTNLTCEPSSAVLKWDSGFDEETAETGLYYNVRAGTTSGGNDIVSGVYGSPLLGNYLRPKLSSEQLGIRLKGLSVGTTYYWSVQTIDTGLEASQWSNEQTFVFTPDIWWKLDETSGTTAEDCVGDNDGIFNGNDPVWGGGAVDLSGVNDYFSVPSLDTAYNNSSVFTVAGWFKTDQSTGMQTIVGQWGQGGTGTECWGWQVLVENNKVKARFMYNEFTMTDITGTSDVNDDEWHQFSMVRNGTSTALYVDGQPENSGTANFSVYGDTKFRIGDGSYVDNQIPPLHGGPFNGMIDDVMIFNRVLSAEEVEQIYQEKQNKRASNPNPPNGATGVVSVNVELTWTAGEFAESHDVYFGETNPPEFVGNQTGTTFDAGTLDCNTTYYWRIDEKSDADTTMGNIWSFTTWSELYQNIAHWWKFDECNGTTAYDFVGDADGTFNGDDPCWVPGPSGCAVDYNGVNDYFSVPSLDTAYSNSSVFTVAGWFKTDQSTGKQTIIGQWSQSWEAGQEYYGWQVLVENNKVVARFGYGIQTPDITGTTDVNVGQWYQFAMVRNGTSTALYVNGQPQDSGTANFFAYNTKFRIGDGSYKFGGNPALKGGPFNGIIDKLMIFDRALSDEEVEELYESGMPD